MSTTAAMIQSHFRDARLEEELMIYVVPFESVRFSAVRVRYGLRSRRADTLAGSICHVFT
jgi:hypothetical protein